MKFEMNFNRFKAYFKKDLLILEKLKINSQDVFDYGQDNDILDFDYKQKSINLDVEYILSIFKDKI